MAGQPIYSNGIIIGYTPEPEAPTQDPNVYTPALDIGEMWQQQQQAAQSTAQSGGGQAPAPGYFPLPQQPVPQLPSPWARRDPSAQMGPVDYLSVLRGAAQPGFTNRNSLVNTSLFSPWAKLFGGMEVTPQLLMGGPEEEPENKTYGGYWGNWRNWGRGGGGRSWYRGSGYTSTPYKTPRWFQDMMMWRI